MDESANRENRNNQNQRPSPPEGIDSLVPDEMGEHDQPRPDNANGGNKIGGFKNWVEGIWNEGPDRQLELIFALIIALSSLGQIVVTVINDRSTSAQVNKIIDTAGGIKDAARQIEEAGWIFSGAAIGINNAGWNAVGKLQDQATQVGRSANAAENAVAATQDQMRLDQRAWVGILGVDAGDFSKTTGFPVVITFSNSGRTPARHVKFSVRYRYTAVPIPGPTDSDIKGLAPESSPDVAPQGRLTRELGTAPTPSVASTLIQIQGNNDIISHFDAISDGSLTLYYFGTVKYEDIFRKPHSTNYCIFVLNPKTKTTGTCDSFNDIE